EDAARKRIEQVLYARQVGRVERLWRENQALMAARNLDECRWELCGWEYDYLRHLLHGGLSYAGHVGGVPALAVSPDGKQQASGGKDATVKLWDAATGDLQRTLSGHTGEV